MATTDASYQSPSDQLTSPLLAFNPGARYHIGQRFATFQLLSESLKQYAQEQCFHYSIRSSKRLSPSGKIARELAEYGLTIDMTRPFHQGYMSITWACIHYGKLRTRSQGHRVCRKHMATNCKWHLIAQYIATASGGVWEITRYVFQHMNHPMTQDHYAHVRDRKSGLRQNKAIVEQVATLMELDVKPQVLREYVERMTKQKVTVKQIHNLMLHIRQKSDHQSDLAQEQDESENETHTNESDLQSLQLI